MADQEAAVTLGAKGVDKLVTDAHRVQQAWSGAGDAISGAVRGAGRVVGEHLSQIAKDVIGTATAMGTIDMRTAVQGARAYREEVTRFSVVAGESVGNLKTGFGEVAKATMESGPAIAAWAKGVGRLTYDYTGALISAKALHDESVATGKSFEEMGQLGVAMHNSLGVTDDMGKALGTIRAQAEKLGTVGGVAAFQDQIQELSGTFSTMALHSDEARNRVTALAGMMSKGYGPAQAGAVQQGMFGAVTKSAGMLNLLGGIDIYDEKGEIDTQKLGPALRTVQDKYRKWLPDKNLRMMALRNLTGDPRAAAALESGDFSEEAIGRLAGVGPSGGARAAAEKYAGSDAGKSRAAELQANRAMQESAEKILPMQDAFRGLFADHPIIGGLASSLVGAGASGLISKGLSKLGGGGGGGGLLSRGLSMFGGGGGGASGGVAEGAALAGGVGLSAIAAIGTAVASVPATIKVLAELGDASKKKMGLGAAENLSPEQAAALSGSEAGAIAAAGGHRSTGVQGAIQLENARLRRGRAGELLSAFEATKADYEQTGKYSLRSHLSQPLLSAVEGPQADPVLKQLLSAFESGQLDTRALAPDIADAIGSRLERSPLKVQLVGAAGGMVGGPEEGMN